MSEFKLVPARMLLDKETIEAINFHCGDGADGQFGEYSDGLLWIGVVTDDEGNEVYGLHLATAEYPEEGSTTLVEFAAPAETSKLEQITAERDALQQRLNAADQRIDELVAELAKVRQGPCKMIVGDELP